MHKEFGPREVGSFPAMIAPTVSVIAPAVTMIAPT